MFDDLELPRHVHKAGGDYLQVNTHDELRAAIKAGWHLQPPTSADLARAKRGAAAKDGDDVVDASTGQGQAAAAPAVDEGAAVQPASPLTAPAAGKAPKAKRTRGKK